MNKIIYVLKIFLLMCFVFLLTSSKSGKHDFYNKIHPQLILRTDSETLNYIILLKSQAELSNIENMKTKIQKGQYVYEQLTNRATRTQIKLLKILQKEDAVIRSFWLVNMIHVKSKMDVLLNIAKEPEVKYIYPNFKGKIEKGFVGTSQPVSPDGIGWNLHIVNASDVWAEGIDGTGAVVGGIDTGYDWQHPAIKHQYRGWQDSAADHNYNWYDAIHSGGINCPPNSPEPCDEDIHGTHTMGLMVGDDSGSNKIGMAPGAKWIGCRCWEPVLRTDITYLTECLQWMIAPTDLNNENPDPAQAPHVVNNSWVCEPDEGCADPNILKPLIENVRAAGIVVLGGAGNNGPECSSSVYPPSIYQKYFAVGATTNQDSIAVFSSRGPISVDSSYRRKPDISAPGRDVRSCIPGGGYLSWSGTSFAGPHVAGLVALLIDANPDLAGNVDLIENIIIETAVPLLTDQECGNIPGNQIPNNTYGFGRIDAYAACQMAISLSDIKDSNIENVAEFRLLPVYPNPFNNTTKIIYYIPERSYVNLNIYNTLGQKINSLISDFQNAGYIQLTWDGKNKNGKPVSSGTYIIQLKSKNVSLVTKALIIK